MARTLQENNVVGMDIAFLTCFFLAVFVISGLHLWRSHKLQQVYKHIRERKFEKGLQLAEALLTKYPKDFQVYLVAATAAYHLQQYEKTVGLCDRAKTLKERSQGLFILSAASKSNLCMPGFLEDAETAVQLFPNYRALLVKSFLLTAAFKYEDALEVCDKLEQIDPNNFASYSSRAFALLPLHKFDQAEKNYEKALALLPKNAEPESASQILRLNASILFHAHNNVDAAIKVISDSLALTEGTVGLINRGFFYSVQGDLDHASEDFTKAAQLDINNERSKAHVNSSRARILLIKGDQSQAMNYANLALVKDNHASILCTRAACWIKVGKLEEAEIDIEQAISINPYYAESYWFKAAILKLRGQEAEAQIFETKALVEGRYIPYF